MPTKQPATEFWFYHMEQAKLEAVLPDILEKILANRATALVKIGACLEDAPAAEMHRLDTFLWTYKQNSFLPHGRDDEPLADEHPILLTHSAKTAMGRDMVVLIGGAEIDDLDEAKRCITILDGHNTDDKAVARARWQAVKTTGNEAIYWKQDERGRWVRPKM